MPRDQRIAKRITAGFAIVVLLLGLLIVGTAVTAHRQLALLATSESPQLADYPLVEVLMPRIPPGSNPNPADVARQISQRIFGLGGLGLLFVLFAGGLLVWNFRRSDST